MKDPKDYISGEILDRCGSWSEDILEAISDAQEDARVDGFNDGVRKALSEVEDYCSRESTARSIY